MDTFQSETDRIGGGASRILTAHPNAGPCPLCGDARALTMFQSRADDSHAPFDIVRCPSCGTARTHPPPPADAIPGYYLEEYYGPRHVKFERATETAVAWFTWWRGLILSKFCPPGGRVLDVGCGRGNLVAEMRRRGFDAFGTELSDTTAGDARRLFGDRVRVGDLTRLSIPDESFDLVVLWHVLEHVPDPAAHARVIRKILAPGGAIAVAVPNIDSYQALLTRGHWFHLDVPRHLWHFSPDSIRRLFGRAGFSIVRQSSLSIEQNPFGWIQSLLNAAGAPRNRLYKTLKRVDPARPGNFSAFERAAWRMLYAAAMPPAILLSAVESACGRGGTFYAIARKGD